jgi:hypothetical protein
MCNTPCWICLKGKRIYIHVQFGIHSWVGSDNGKPSSKYFILFFIKKVGRKIEELLEYSGFYLIIYLRHGIFKVNLTNMS